MAHAAGWPDFRNETFQSSTYPVTGSNGILALALNMEETRAMNRDLTSTPEGRQWLSSSREGTSGFRFQLNLIGAEYTDAYSVDLVQIDQGGGSETHIDDYNHAFYFLEGEGEVCIADERIATAPGVVIKIPAGVVHSVGNIGEAPLRFLTIYDPPRMRVAEVATGTYTETR
ncbi:cupin domain-containing protein [Xenophilus azovorans]|uniref:cupin domain-containing protein n=1 Tax=Xenophilus azovorans TaxID=151755 RepID=UPI0009FEEEC2|nr:cupin domain-containing protein [Xenophilus azovorans]